MKKISGVFAVVLMLGLANSASAGLEVRYWGADWSPSSAPGRNSAGMFGLDVEESGISTFGGARVMAGKYDVGQDSSWRVDADLRIGHWFKKPLVGGFVGYHVMAFDISDLEEPLFGSTLHEGGSFPHWELLHGPVVGVKGSYPLSNIMPLGGEKQTYDLALYYDSGFVPWLSTEVLSGVDDYSKGEGGQSWHAEAGLMLTHDTLDQEQSGARITLRGAYRYQEIMGMGKKNGTFSGLIAGLFYQW